MAQLVDSLPTPAASQCPLLPPERYAVALKLGNGWVNAKEFVDSEAMGNFITKFREKPTSPVSPGSLVSIHHVHRDVHLITLSNPSVFLGGKLTSREPYLCQNGMRPAGLVLIQEGAAIRPAVTFTPDYKKIFTSEQITMTCDVGSTIGEGMDYIWYKDSEQVYNGKSYIIQKAETSHSGSYQCQTRPGEISDPARLDVSNRWLILQTPLYVYEGDDIYIRCHHYPGFPGEQIQFYKDNRNITDWSYNEEYYISNVTKMTAGTYGCIKLAYYEGLYYQPGDDISVSVQDLFTTPTISVTPQPVITTDKMALTCQTSLPPPPRHNTQLRIAFYREGGIVQGFGVSDTYEVYNVQLEDSGKYSCEVETTDGRVRKRSAETIIQIGDNIGYTQQNIIRLTLSGCVLVVAALFVFYHIKWMKSMESADHPTT
ncbi:high affinity immunoglobulin gamma Fc receptor I-like [Leptodactylus fuscus]|uniref:high affinity immunoglobulin gamma Fc receptor I-like n=1 Tax=Leptodactylus fuscus TaxID=238119 RepID=UPI003F4EE3FF